MTVPHFPMFAALRHPNFRRFWTAEAVSLVGSWMQNAAQGYLVLSLFPRGDSRGVTALGLVSACQFLPSLLLALFAGVLADRAPRKTVLLITQTTLLLTAALLAAACFSGFISVPVIAALALIQGTARVFESTARESLVPSLVPTESVPNAVALDALAFNGSRILGTALYGVLVPFLAVLTMNHMGREVGRATLVASGAMFALNALSFVAVIVAVARTALPPGRKHAPPVLADLVQGLAFVWRTPPVRWPVLLLLALSVTSINFSLIVPVFARGALGLGATGYGALLTCLAVGSVLGASWQANRAGRQTAPVQSRERSRVMVGAAALLSGALGLLALTPGPALAGAVLVLAGAGMIAAMTSVNAAIQLATPDALRGRVMSVYVLVDSGAAPMGALVVGTLLGGLGARWGVAAVGGLALLCVLTLGSRLLSAPRHEDAPAAP